MFKYILIGLLSLGVYTYSTVDAGRVAKYKAIIKNVKTAYPETRFLSTSLILGMIETESSFREDVMSNKGAIGAMQLKPSTFNWILSAHGIRAGSITNPEQNILAGMLFLKWLSDRLDGNLFNAVQAYNTGLEGFKRGRTARDYASNVYLSSFKYILL